MLVLAYRSYSHRQAGLGKRKRSGVLMALIGKAVVCTCGEIGIVTSTPRLEYEPATITHLHGRTHKVMAMWSPDQIDVNEDGYYKGDR